MYILFIYIYHTKNRLTKAKVTAIKEKETEITIKGENPNE